MALPKSHEDFDDLELEPLCEEELNWVETHWDGLRERYGGQWIAVVKDSVVAHGSELVEVGKAVDQKGIVDAFYKFIPLHSEEPPIVIM